MHVSAAKAFGAGNLYILKNHIVPDMGPILIAGFVQHARRAVFMEAGLAFLGIADPTMISWGTMLNHALQFSYMNMWFWILSPGIILSFTVLTFSFLGYSLETILNPRLRLRKYA
jgi:peptide/nickel transport system permease protein